MPEIIDAPKSLFQQQVDWAELVLMKMKQAAENLGVVEDFYLVPYGSLTPSRLEDCYSKDTAPFDFQVTFASEGRFSKFGEKGPSSKEDYRMGPRWMELRSENRLSWGNSLLQILSALNGLPVHVSLSSSWRWDTGNPRPNGGASYVPVYVAFIAHSPNESFSVEAQQHMLSHHCMAEHALADRSLFDWQEDTSAPVRFSAYRWTPNGFTVFTSTKKEAEELQKTTLQAFSCKVEKSPSPKPPREWRLHVDLTSP